MKAILLSVVGLFVPYERLAVFRILWFKEFVINIYTEKNLTCLFGGFDSFRRLSLLSLNFQVRMIVPITTATAATFASTVPRPKVVYVPVPWVRNY